jgi:hypothetical protein
MFSEILGQETSYQLNDNISHLQRSTTILQLLYIYMLIVYDQHVYI